MGAGELCRCGCPRSAHQPVPPRDCRTCLCDGFEPQRSRVSRAFDWLRSLGRRRR
jgi:hypothetical protein